MALDQVVSWRGHLARCLTVTCSSATIHLAKCMDWSLIQVTSRTAQGGSVHGVWKGLYFLNERVSLNDIPLISCIESIELLRGRGLLSTCCNRALYVMFWTNCNGKRMISMQPGLSMLGSQSCKNKPLHDKQSSFKCTDRLLARKCYREWLGIIYTMSFF